MTELREQIYSIASTVTGLTTSTVYYGEAPQDLDYTATTAYPYLVFEILASNKDRDTGSQWRLAKVQFDLFGQSASALETIADAFDADLRDDANYSWTEFSLIDMFEDFRSGPTSVPSDDNKYLWQITIQYTYTLEEI